MNAREADLRPDDWCRLLHECVVYGLLFKAAAADLAMLRQVPLKLSYEPALEALSRWAEKRHYRLRRTLLRHGCRWIASEKQGHVYCVKVRVRGYLREALYSVEVLRAACAERVKQWAVEQGGDSDET